MAKNIDEIFEENLKNHSQEPSKNLWEEVEARLDHKIKQKRRKIWLSVAASLLLLLVSLSLWLIQPEQQKLEISEENEHTKTKKPQIVQNETQDKQKLKKHLKSDHTKLKKTYNSQEKITAKPKQVENSLVIKAKEEADKLEKIIETDNSNGKQIAITRKEENTETEEDLEVTVVVSLHSEPKAKKYTPGPQKPSKVAKVWHKFIKVKNGEEVATE